VGAGEGGGNGGDRKARLRIGAFGALRCILGISLHHVFVGYTNWFFLDRLAQSSPEPRFMELVILCSAVSVCQLLGWGEFRARTARCKKGRVGAGRNFA
jgi:hypothetical protein